MEWYRTYHGLPFDPKLQVVANRTQQPMALIVAIWMCVLDAASQHDPRGIVKVDLEAVSVIQGIELETVEKVLLAFYEKGLIDSEDRLNSWEKRQHTTSAERVKKHRDAKKRDVTSCNTAQRSVTKSNEVKQNLSVKDSDTEAEQIQITDAEGETKQNTDSKKNRTQKRESERETDHKFAEGNSKKRNRLSAELDQMLQIWNAEVQSQITPNQPAKLTPKRQRLMRQRWHEEFQQDMAAWQYFCEIIGQSDFCLGKIPGKKWVIDLTWAVASTDHVAKILEGGYSGGNHPNPEPQCYVGQAKEAWQTIIRQFKRKYGKAVYQSWLSRTEILTFEEGHGGATVVMSCRNNFTRDWIRQHYLEDLERWWQAQSTSHYHISRVKLVLQEEDHG